MWSVRYYAVIRQSQESPYEFTVVFPQQGIITEGKTLNKAIKSAQRALGKWLSDTIIGNHKMPVPIRTPDAFNLEPQDSIVLIEAHLSI